MSLFENTQTENVSWSFGMSAHVPQYGQLLCLAFRWLCCVHMSLCGCASHIIVSVCTINLVVLMNEGFNPLGTISLNAKVGDIAYS